MHLNHLLQYGLHLTHAQLTPKLTGFHLCRLHQNNFSLQCYHHLKNNWPHYHLQQPKELSQVFWVDVVAVLVVVVLVVAVSDWTFQLLLPLSIVSDWDTFFNLFFISLIILTWAEISVDFT